jgi:hypothetical protein
MEKGDEEKRWMRRWGSVAWWIVTCYSVLFSLYTLPFVYGDFEITILENLRAWQVIQQLMPMAG